MRMIVADCVVEYSGRGSTTSSRGIRLVMQKADGTVLIHRDKGMMAMNYMGGVKRPVVEETVDADGNPHMVATCRGERIDVTLYDVLLDMTFDDMDGDGDALERRGTERQMQEWLSRPEVFPAVFGDGCRFLMREWQTGKGPVDLLGMDAEGNLMLVEVKRHAKMSDVYQVLRYATAMANQRDEMRRRGIDSTDIGRDESIVIPATAFEHPVLCLVSGKNVKSARTECEEHGVRFVHVRDGWVSSEVDDVTARRVVSQRVDA